MERTRGLSWPLTVAVGVLLVACGVDGGDALGPCAPVDVGGECFDPAHDAFVEHALTSAGAWPQLDDVDLSADRVIEAVDHSEGSPTWLVPLTSGDRMVAISRFIPVGDQVKLGEVALLEEPLDFLPGRFNGELVLFVDTSCFEDASVDCLFSEMRWAVELPNGDFELPDGRVVERLSGEAG